MLSNVGQGPLTAIAFNFGTPRLGIIRRDQNITNGGALAPLTSPSGEVFTQASASVSIPGATKLGMRYVPEGNGCTSQRLYDPSATTTTTIYGVPASAQRAGDVHLLSASTADGQTVFTYFHTLAAPSLSFGGALSGTAITAGSSTVFKQLHASATLSSSYNELDLLYSDPDHAIAITSTPAYAGGQTVTLTMPDLTTVSGYQTSWLPPLASSVASGLSAFSLASGCADGSVVRIRR